MGKTKIYPELNEEEYKDLSDRYLLLRKGIRKYEDKFDKKNLKKINELTKEIANTLYLNTREYPQLKQDRIKHLEKINTLSKPIKKVIKSKRGWGKPYGYDSQNKPNTK